MPNILYQNNGDGTFTDVSERSHIARYVGKGMGVAFADYDDDGHTDIFQEIAVSGYGLFDNVPQELAAAMAGLECGPFNYLVQVLAKRPQFLLCPAKSRRTCCAGIC